MIDYEYETIDKITNNEPATKDNVELDAICTWTGLRGKS
jgi:hypothetical protein